MDAMRIGLEGAAGAAGRVKETSELGYRCQTATAEDVRAILGIFVLANTFPGAELAHTHVAALMLSSTSRNASSSAFIVSGLLAVAPLLA